MGLQAKIVYDGGIITVPDAMGSPRSDQLVGTSAEQLCELAGRVCYDSLGTGRDSDAYFKHIVESNHLSVLGHFNFTFTIDALKEKAAYVLSSLLNRPGLFVNVQADGDYLLLTITSSLRVWAEWDLWTSRGCKDNDFVRQKGLSAACYFAPTIFKHLGHTKSLTRQDESAFNNFPDEFQWVSMYLRMGRTASHEQVRHGYRTAISQRSTRYCDESDSEIIEHPLLVKATESVYLPQFVVDALALQLNRLKEVARSSYRDVNSLCSIAAKEAGVDPVTAKKQARGAARGFLRMATETDMIFSASLPQWAHMLRMRLHPAADAEIRELYSMILTELKSSYYSQYFSKFTTVNSPDGIGVVLKETK